VRPRICGAGAAWTSSTRIGSHGRVRSFDVADERREELLNAIRDDVLALRARRENGADQRYEPDRKGLAWGTCTVRRAHGGPR